MPPNKKQKLPADTTTFNSNQHMPTSHLDQQEPADDDHIWIDFDFDDDDNSDPLENFLDSTSGDSDGSSDSSGGSCSSNSSSSSVSVSSSSVSSSSVSSGGSSSIAAHSTAFFPPAGASPRQSPAGDELHTDNKSDTDDESDPDREWKQELANIQAPPLDSDISHLFSNNSGARSNFIERCNARFSLFDKTLSSDLETTEKLRKLRSLFDPKESHQREIYNAYERLNQDEKPKSIQEYKEQVSILQGAYNRLEQTLPSAQQLQETPTPR